MAAKKIVSVWRTFLAQNIQAKMSYKADFAMGILANFLMQS